MQEKDRKRLQVNRLALVRGIVTDEDLLSFLMSKNILTDPMKDEISVKATKRDKAGALLDLLPRRGPYAFRAFVEGLVETEQDPLADLLDGQIAASYRHQVGKAPAHYPTNTPTQPPTHYAYNPSPALPEVLAKEKILPEDSIFPDVNKLQNTDPALIRRVVEDTKAHYQMEKRPRGRCIIINIDKFSKESKKKDRDGSYSDVTNLTQVFQKLYFDVELWDNKTRDEILEQVNIERKNEAHAKNDAFVMAILSHGKEDIIYGIDGGEVRISKEIVHQFGGLKCKGLINKPKIFFIQACQGGGESKGVVVPDDAGDTHQSDEEDYGEILKEDFVHEDADLLVVAGTVPGYKAWRNVIQGSWFISDLTLALVQYAHFKHLEEIVTIVTRYVSERSRDKTGHKQICQKKGQLRRDLYFLPGYSVSNC